MKFQNEADFNENNVPSRGRYPFPSNKVDKYNIYLILDSKEFFGSFLQVLEEGLHVLKL